MAKLKQCYSPKSTHKEKAVPSSNAMALLSLRDSAPPREGVEELTTLDYVASILYCVHRARQMGRARAPIRWLDVTPFLRAQWREIAEKDFQKWVKLCRE